MTYAYARVSTKDQNESRQIAAFEAAGFSRDSIFVDHESGKDFNRKAYKRLRRTLKRGDLLVVQSLDRFGRDYDGILEEWRYLTKRKCVDIKVLNMPILDTTQGMGLVGRFIGDIVLQLLSFVAETERRNIKERQAQGIASAKARGVRFGRPRLARPAELETLVGQVKRGEMKANDAARKINVSRTTFRRWMNGGCR